MSKVKSVARCGHNLQSDAESTFPLAQQDGANKPHRRPDLLLPRHSHSEAHLSAAHISSGVCALLSPLHITLHRIATRQLTRRLLEGWKGRPQLLGFPISRDFLPRAITYGYSPSHCALIAHYGGKEGGANSVNLLRCLYAQWFKVRATGSPLPCVRKSSVWLTVLSMYCFLSN